MAHGVVVITGASRRIGAETARLAADRGYSVCVNYGTDSVQANALVSELESTGVRAVACRADVASKDEVLFACADELGTLVALVNNGAFSRLERASNSSAWSAASGLAQ